MYLSFCYRPSSSNIPERHKAEILQTIYNFVLYKVICFYGREYSSTEAFDSEKIVVESQIIKSQKLLVCFQSVYLSYNVLKVFSGNI